ncbi:hypothetical protein ACI6Q2_17590 [Chitinophagaceae bacterium LWZ2-11]
MAENYITASCVISNQTVLKNGQSLFENNDADLQSFLLSTYNHFELNYPKFYKMDLLSKLGWLASEVLLKDSFPKDQYSPDEIGIVLSNTNSSLDSDIKYLASVQDFASPALFVYTLPNIVIGEICIRNKFKGENAFFVFDEFDVDFTAQYVNNLLEKGILKACICGWVEVLNNNYKVVLYLAEKEKRSEGIPFTKENMKAIFES